MTEQVHGEVQRLMQQKVDELRTLIGEAPPDFGESEVAEKFESLMGLMADGAAMDELAEQSQEFMTSVQELGTAQSDADQFAQWSDALQTHLSETVMVAGVEAAIADTLANGLANGDMPDVISAGGGAGGVTPPGGIPLPGSGGAGGIVPPGADGIPLPGGGGAGGIVPPGAGGIPLPPGGGAGGIAPPGGFPLPPGGGGAGGGAGPTPPPWWGPWHPWWHHHHGGFYLFCPWLPHHLVWWICPGVYACGGPGPGLVCGPPAMCGLPMPMVEPVSSVANVAYEGRIVLLNPEETGSDVQFLLDNQPLSLDSGSVQDYNRTRTTIRFDRGGEFGEARYTLKPGSYKFLLTERGWELVKTSFEATLDNTANRQEFNLLVDGEPVVIPARSTQLVTSAYPLLVEFDNGSGQDPARKLLQDEEAYTIGISQETGLWDVFPGDASDSGTGRAADGYTLARMGESAPEPGNEVATPIAP